MRKMSSVLKGVGVLAILAWASSAHSAPIMSYTDVIGGAPLANFEGFPEFTIITSQYAGVTFGQVDGGTPMIDNYLGNGGAGGCSGFAWCFGYGSSSGSGVLTGSTNGGAFAPTIAGLTATFATPRSQVEIFLSDTSPLGNYGIFAYNSSNVLLESFTVPGSAILPPGYAGGVFPPPGTFPLPGIYVGFIRGSADISRLQVGPSTAFGDAFAVDDLRASAAAVPEPGSLALLGTGLVVAWRARRRITGRV